MGSACTSGRPKSPGHAGQPERSCVSGNSSSATWKPSSPSGKRSRPRWFPLLPECPLSPCAITHRPSSKRSPGPGHAAVARTAGRKIEGPWNLAALNAGEKVSGASIRSRAGKCSTLSSAERLRPMGAKPAAGSGSGCSSCARLRVPMEATWTSARRRGRRRSSCTCREELQQPPKATRDDRPGSRHPGVYIIQIMRLSDARGIPRKRRNSVSMFSASL